MTFPAVQPAMRTLQRECGQSVIEFCLAAVPMNKRKVTSLMLHMAGLTALVLRPTVQPGMILPLLSDDTMTLQAILRHEFLIAAMTFAAVLHPFKERMALLQFTR